jgi:hypothetical protein
MVSEQKFTEVIRSIYFDYDMERELTRSYDDLKFSIITTLSKMSPMKDNNAYTDVAYVIKQDDGDIFFKSAIIYETPEDVLVLDLKEIKLDEFLDYINKNKYIKHGL